MHAEVYGYRASDWFLLLADLSSRTRATLAPALTQEIKPVNGTSHSRDLDITLLTPVMSVALYRWKVLKPSHFLMKLTHIQNIV